MVRCYPLNHLFVWCALKSLYHSIYLSTYPELDLCGSFQQDKFLSCQCNIGPDIIEKVGERL